ncbi:MAG: helix-turn-helix domain-containing protein [Lachnospiraceae bacterium]|nr:helix-turn-helix domain-containing protein [Lachnospiraceae bacterium]
MELTDRLKEQLFYYHNATDIPLELYDENGGVVQSFSDDFRYCSMVREACGSRSFCGRMHNEGASLSKELDDGYVFSCPAGLVHFVVSVKMPDGKDFHILAGPLAMDYPDISVIDNVIRGYELPMDIRQRLYAALNAIPIVEPMRIQYLCKLLFSLVDNLMRSPSAGEEKEKELPDTYREAPVAIPIVQKAVAYIDDHYNESLKLENVAAYVGLNTSYLSTIFKRELKISFSGYLTQKRIEEACRLLLRSNDSLSDIASQVGFENQSYFSQIFKDHTGMSPKEYRKRG